MLRGFLSGQRSAEPAAIRSRWEELRREQPELAEGIDLQRTVQRLQRDASLAAEPPPCTREVSDQRLAAGIPLLFGSRPFVETGGVERLFRRLCSSAVRGEASSEARELLDLTDKGLFDLVAAVQATCALDSAALSDVLSALGDRADLGVTLLQYAVAPAFRLVAHEYATLVEASPWTRSVCPVCGAEPLLGELRGGESRRVLRCGHCGAAWDFQRLRCVYCDTRDHRQLSALHVEGQSDFLRVELCDACSGYIKSIARLDPIQDELLPAEDLATSHLDLLALERGYTRPHAI